MTEYVLPRLVDDTTAIQAFRNAYYRLTGKPAFRVKRVLLSNYLGNEVNTKAAVFTLQELDTVVNMFEAYSRKRTKHLSQDFEYERGYKILKNLLRILNEKEA